MPRCVGKGARELDTARGIFREERVRVVYEQVCVEQLVGVFFGILRGRFGAAEVDSVPVPRDDGVDRRVLPGADTVEAEFVPSNTRGSQACPW